MKMIEKDYPLDMGTIKMLCEAIKHSRNELRGYSHEHITHVYEMLNKVSRNYTADRHVHLMVMKEPLLR